jgi:hypothetical protein
MAKNPNPSLLDQAQIIKRVYDEANDAIRVDAKISANIDTQEVVISHVDDSIKIGDGSSLVGTTTVDGDVGLNAVIIGGVVSGNFQATGLSTGFRTLKMIVGDIPTKVPPIPLANRNGISVRVIGTEDVYFGTSNVTINNGYPKKQYEEMILDVRDNSAVELYAVCAPGTSCEVRVMEIA